jgi:hypothetical protein
VDAARSALSTLPQFDKIFSGNRLNSVLIAAPFILVELVDDAAHNDKCSQQGKL